ncbi:MAG: DUF4115 domain-containing protein [Gammaproteobacteria bacterium]|nr:DUF4115 domain-containing protein [Gammaproteobacteria bacterium]
MNHHDDQAVDEESPSGETSFVGQELKAAREALDLPIKQLAGDLRIDPHYLVALEENDFAAFSAPVFAKGYLKQYATRLGLDEKALLADYDRQVGTHELPRLRTPTFQSIADQQQARWLIAISAIVFVVAAILIWWFSTPEPAAPVVGQPATTVPVAVPASPVVRQPAATIPVAEPASTTAELEEAVAAQPVPPEPLSSGGPTAQVEINFREESWVEVVDARGERLFYGLGGAGDRTRFVAALPLSIVLGNADGVELFVDEKRYSIPVNSRQRDPARFVIPEPSD